MTVMVTGAFGFVGLNIVEQLVLRGRKAVAVDLGAPPGMARRMLDEAGGLVTVRGLDIRDTDAVAEIVEACEVTAIVHCAAVTANREREMSDPERIVGTNALGTLSVMQAAARNGVARVVLLSSGSVYGSAAFGAIPIGEQDTCPMADTLYAVSKLAGEGIALRLAELWNIGLSVLRPASTFGRWELQTELRDTLSPILQVTRLARAGESAVFARDPLHDWIYGPDLANACLLLLCASGVDGRVYNVSSGPRGAWTLTAWCEHLKRRYPGFGFRLAGPGEVCNVNVYDHRHRALLDTARLHADTGFQPRFGMDAAFDDYMSWIDRQEMAV